MGPVTIDLFTTVKPFEGLARVHQANALRSWRAHPGLERIFVFGGVKGDTTAIGETGAEVVEDVATTANGLPSVKAMFETAAERSRADLLMFSNADMIYLPEFFEEVGRCCSEAGDRFLIVGSRMDLDCERDFSFADATVVEEFRRFARSTGRLHPPAGSDYFIFPREQYLKDRLPDLWIGRGGWDLYMILHANRSGISTIDVTPSTWGCHQNHDYGLRGANRNVRYEDDPEAAFNLSLLPKGIPWSEWTLKGCKREWSEGELREKAPLPKREAARRVRPERKRPVPAKNSFLRRLWRRLARRLRGTAGADSPAMRPREVVKPKSVPPAIPKDGPVNLVVGASKTSYEGWISTNIDQLDLLSLPDWERLLGGVQVDRVLAEHVWEHLTPTDGLAALKNVFAHLKPGGRIRIAVPDGNHPDPDYREHVRPGGSGPGADDHKVLYTRDLLEWAMQEAGFRPEALEYWDDSGEFRSREWSPDDGMVVRSLRHDPRNAGGRPVYTSLIVDGIKEEGK